MGSKSYMVTHIVIVIVKICKAFFFFFFVFLLSFIVLWMGYSCRDPLRLVPQTLGLVDSKEISVLLGHES